LGVRRAICSAGGARIATSLCTSDTLRILRVEVVIVTAIHAHVVSLLLLGVMEVTCVHRAHALLADDTPIQGALRMLNVALAHAA
jgi:hypothetical protein